MIKNTTKWEHSSLTSNLLESLIAVITSLKLLSLPHPSVTYFNVIELVLVNNVPSDCFVLRHEISAECFPDA